MNKCKTIGKLQNGKPDPCYNCLLSDSKTCLDCIDYNKYQGKFWTLERVKVLKQFLENEWKSENFTTRELMEGYYHQLGDEPREYVPKELIDQVLTEGG